MSKFSLWTSLFLSRLAVLSNSIFSSIMCTNNVLYSAFPPVATLTSPLNPHANRQTFISVKTELYPSSTRLIINTTTKLIKGLSIIAGWESRSNKSILVTNEEEL